MFNIISHHENENQNHNESRALVATPITLATLGAAIRRKVV
jgi:hypothetical protein